MASSLQGNRGRNLTDVRLANRSVIFRTIREAGGISRSELAYLSGLNPATVTHIVRELIEQGVVQEDGYDKSRGGRRRSLLRIRTQVGYIVGISLERGSLLGILTDLDMQKTTRRSLPSNAPSHSDITLTTLLNLIGDLIDESGVEREKIIGIGLCAPGPLDSRQGLLTAPVNMPEWKGLPLRHMIEEAVGIATFVDNNANTCALAEKWFGGAKEMDDFVYLLVDTGVGAGIMAAGDVYRGAHDIAGEIGHTTVDLSGVRCGCGNVGCLELYASPPASVRHVQQAIADGRDTLVHAQFNDNPEAIDFEAVTQAARSGDAVACEALDKMAQALAVGIVNTVNAFDPEAIFLGGRICLALDLLLNPLREWVTQRVMCDDARSVAILASDLQMDGPLVGAVCLVLQELFDNPKIDFSDPALGALPLHTD